MSTLTDSFPAAALDATRWTATQVGTVGLVVGVPSDGVYPQTVDDDGDAVTVSSSGKIMTPGNHPFDMEIYYRDVFDDPAENIVSFLGWRSLQLDGGGSSAYGVDVLLCVKPGPLYELQKRTTNLGGVSRATVISDPLAGADGGFRIVRSGKVYSLYYADGGWQLLESITLPHVGPGYVIFGQFAETPGLDGFPWIP